MEKIGEKDHGSKWMRNKSLTWFDIHKPTRQKMKIFESRYSFHELSIDDCLSKIQIPKVDRYEDHVFAILHFPILDRERIIPHFAQLSIFAGSNYLITVHQGELHSLKEMFERCKTDPKQRDLFMGNSPGYLLHRIIDLLADDLLHVLMKVQGNLDDIQDLVFDERVAVARDISMLRREITALRRMVYPLKRTILEISMEIQRYSEEDLTPYFDDIRDHINKVIELLDDARETVEIFKDTDFMFSTERSNKILAILTILFTLSIPASVIAPFYGMNVNLPGGIETGPATFFGQYTSFFILIIAAILPAAIMMYWFKRRGWLKF